jgi:hypothetical protein
MAEMGDVRKRRDVLDAVGAMVKAAIGESRVWVKSYSQDWPNGTLPGTGDPVITVEVEGEAQGKLRLSGNVVRRVRDLVEAERKTSELERAQAEIEALKDRLARLHTLSDLRGTSHE